MSMSEFTSSTFEGSETQLQNVSSLHSSGLTKLERFKLHCKPTFRIRHLRNKGAILILLWNYLIATAFFAVVSKGSADDQYTLPFIVFLTAGGLTLVVAGWVADVCFGRYKVMRLCGLPIF